MDDGSWVILEFPGYATAVEGTQVSSLAELREASQTSWFSENGTLWAKLVVDNGAGLTVAPGNAPPGFAARALPLGAKIEVGSAEGAAGQQAAARYRRRAAMPPAGLTPSRTRFSGSATSAA